MRILRILFAAFICTFEAIGQVGETLPATRGGARIQFDGSAGMVSGSMHILTTPGGKLLIDCGAYYGDDAGEAADDANCRLPAGCEDARAILVTHAHADHVGRIPLLVERGFRGAIYATPASIDFMQVTFEQAARYAADPNRNWVWSSSESRNARDEPYIPVMKAHWREDCEWMGKIRARNRETYRGAYQALVQHMASMRTRVSPCKVCASHEVLRVKKLFRSISLEEPFSPAPGVAVSAWRTGHLPGAVAYHVKLALPNSGDVAVLFSGDVGPSETMIQLPFSPPPPADYVLMEATYGSKASGAPPSAAWVDFRRELLGALADGKVVWIPAFALDRTEKVLFQIESAFRDAGDAAPGRPKIFVPSPSACAFHDLYRKRGSDWDLKPEYLRMNGLALDFDRGLPGPVRGLLDAIQARDWSLEGFKSPEALQAAAMQSLRGNVLITTSGMVDSVFSRALLEPLAASDDVVIFLVGYQDPATPGGSIESATRDNPGHVMADGQALPLRAAPRRVQGFSGHGKADDLDAWLSKQP